MAFDEGVYDDPTQDSYGDPAPSAPNQTWTFAGYRWPDNKKIFKDNTGQYGTADDGATFIPITIDPSQLHDKEASGGSGEGEGSTGGLDFPGGDPLAWAQQQFANLPPTVESLIKIHDALKAKGINVERPTNASGLSSDKLTINGKMYDFIRDVGGPGAAWQFGEVGGGEDTGFGAVGTTGSAGSLAGLLDPYPGTFTPPDPQAAAQQAIGLLPPVPQYQAPATPQIAPFPTPPPFQAPDPFRGPDPFAYQDFQAPTGDAIYQDPSYQFRVDQGRKALEASASAKGTLRTGGTLKDLLHYGQQFASNEYGNIYDRKAADWQRNRDNAFQSWDANYRTMADEYDRNFGNLLTSYETNYRVPMDAYKTNRDTALSLYDRDAAQTQAAFAPQMQRYQNESAAALAAPNEAYDRSWQEYLQDWKMYEEDQKKRRDWTKWQSEFGLDAASL